MKNGVAETTYRAQDCKRVPIGDISQVYISICRIFKLIYPTHSVIRMSIHPPSADCVSVPTLGKQTIEREGKRKKQRAPPPGHFDDSFESGPPGPQCRRPWPCAGVIQGPERSKQRK